MVKLDKTKLVKSLAQKHKLVPLLEREIAKGEFEWSYHHVSKESDDAWHPSGDCVPSLRDLYLKATAQLEERAFSSSLIKAFQVGHFWHQYLQEVTLRAGICEEADIERRGLKGWGDHSPGNWAPFHWVTGAGDLAPCRIPGHGDYLVDFKTMGSHDFKRNGMPDWCAEKYECQINIYMELFDLEKALIIPVLKDSGHDMKEFEFHRNQALIDKLLHKWELVSVCLDEGVEPPVDEEIDLPLKGPVI